MFMVYLGQKKMEETERKYKLLVRLILQGN